MTKDTSLAHRKAKCTLRVTDQAGNVVANQRLTLRQTNHEFLFGCGAFDFLAYTNSDADSKMDGLQDKINKWLALYNYGTLPFYLSSFEPVEGEPRTAANMNAAEFLRDNHVTVKGHPLCWHTACANWLMKYDNKTILEKQLARIRRDVTAFQGIIDTWDVINEVVIMPTFDKYDNAITRICKDLGRVRLIKETFAAARAANPDAQLLINDFNTSVSYEILIDGCLNAGVPIDVIGIQSHQHQGYWGAENLEKVLERYERFGLPIHFTENTLVSGDLIPPEIQDLNDFHAEEWPSTPEGEERQMKQTEEMYRILFAHPLVQAITGWDFTDGAWLGAPSGLLRRDNSVKPVYERLMQLIKEEWWTVSEISTDENGMVQAQGFKGDYVLEAGNRKAELKLTAGLPEQQVVLK